ncbi:MAG: transposase [Acidobacteriaceae bacterium]
MNQAVHGVIRKPNKIGASTPYDFSAHNQTAYGGLLPVATILEKLGFQQLIEETLTIQRQTRAIPMFRFILGMVLACYVGFSRLHPLRFLKREPILTGILRVAELPPQCTFWRFLASLHLGIVQQLLSVQKRMRERVWAAARHRRAITQAFVAKAVFNLNATRQLLDRLSVDVSLRRICGWESRREIPHESQFSRAFAEFAASELPQRLHEALIKATQQERLIGHISRDSDGDRRPRKAAAHARFDNSS